MRKTSQDGGDSSSITSGIENEIKKSGAAINKTKKNSIKRKIPNFSNESDETVIEPLLQTDKENPETSDQSAKCNILMLKTKTDANSGMGSDKDKLISNETMLQSLPDRNAIEPTLSSNKDNVTTKSPVILPPIHNHMNTNVFSSIDGLKSFAVPKSQILIEIDGSKHVAYNPSPLIFTTAKIHTDGKTKQMEPVQVTPVPILSTEVSVLKSGGIINNNDIAGVSTNVTTMVVNSTKNTKNATVDKDRPKPGVITTNNIPTLSDKIVDVKSSISLAKTSVANTIMSKESIPSVVTKDIKKSEPIFTAHNVTTLNIGRTPTECKLIADNTKHRDNHQTKMAQQQPTSSSILGDKKVITPVGSTKAMASAPTPTTIKDTAKHIKPEYNNSKQTPPLDPNKNTEVATTVADSMVCDNTKVVTDVKNTPDSISKNKGLKTTNGSLNNKQLQRQKVAITPDIDDSLPKIQPNIKLPSSSNDIKSENSANAKITTQIKPPVSEVNSTKEKSKPLSTSKSQTTAVSNPTSTISTTSSISKLSVSDTSTIKKTTTATTTLQANPSRTTVLSEHLKNKSLSTTKSSINTVPSSASVTKSETSKAVGKPQITSGTKTASISVTSSVKPTKATDAAVANTTSQITTPTVSVANSKTTAQSLTGKPAESIANSSAASKPSTIKSNPTSINSITTQAKVNITSTAASTGASSASIQKSSGSIKKSGEKSQDRDSKDSKSKA